MTLCPVCRTEAVHHLALPHTEVVRCSSAHCGLQFALKQLEDKELSQAYRSFYYPSNGQAPRLQFPSTPTGVLRQMFRQLQNRMPPFEGLRLLDYGCGLGSLLVVAREFGFTPEGIEQDPVACHEASATVGNRIYRSIDDLSRHDPAARFDLVTVWNVIEHLREPWADLQQLRRLLRPGGSLLVTTMNVHCVRARLEGSKWENYANPTHFYYFDRRSLQRLIRHAGFGSVKEWKPHLRHPHHGTMRTLFYDVSNYIGVSGVVFYLSGVESSSATAHPAAIAGQKGASSSIEVGNSGK